MYSTSKYPPLRYISRGLLFVWPLWVIFVVIMNIICTLWVIIRLEEDRHFQLNVQAAAEDVQYDTSQYLADLFKSLDRMDGRWEHAGGTPHYLWIEDAKAYVAHYPTLAGVEWVDKNAVVQWIEPLEPNKKIIGYRNYHSYGLLKCINLVT